MAHALKFPVFGRANGLARFFLHDLLQESVVSDATIERFIGLFDFDSVDDSAFYPGDVHADETSRIVMFFSTGDIRYLSHSILDSIYEYCFEQDEEGEDDDEPGNFQERLTQLLETEALCILLKEQAEQKPDTFLEVFGSKTAVRDVLAGKRHVSDSTWKELKKALKKPRLNRSQYNPYRTVSCTINDKAVPVVTMVNGDYIAGDFHAPADRVSHESVQEQEDEPIAPSKIKKVFSHAFAALKTEFHKNSPVDILATVETAGEKIIIVDGDEDVVYRLRVSPEGAYYTESNPEKKYDLQGVIAELIDCHILEGDKTPKQPARKADRSSLVPARAQKKEEPARAFVDDEDDDDDDDDEFMQEEDERPAVPAKKGKAAKAEYLSNPFTEWQMARNPNLREVHRFVEETWGEDSELMQPYFESVKLPFIQTLVELWPNGLYIEYKEVDHEYFLWIDTDFISIVAGADSVEITRKYLRGDLTHRAQRQKSGIVANVQYAVRYFDTMSSTDLEQQLKSAGYWWDQGLRSIASRLEVETYPANPDRFYESDDEQDGEETHLFYNDTAYTAAEFIVGLAPTLHELRGATLDESRLVSVGSADNRDYREIILTTPELELRGIVQRTTQKDGIEITVPQSANPFNDEDSTTKDMELLRISGAVVEEYEDRAVVKIYDGMNQLYAFHCLK